MKYWRVLELNKRLHQKCAEGNLTNAHKTSDALWRHTTIDSEQFIKLPKGKRNFWINNLNLRLGSCGYSSIQLLRVLPALMRMTVQSPRTWMPAASRESGWQGWVATGGSGELLTSQTYKQVKRYVWDGARTRWTGNSRRWQKQQHN